MSDQGSHILKDLKDHGASERQLTTNIFSIFEVGHWISKLSCISCEYVLFAYEPSVKVIALPSTVAPLIRGVSDSLKTDFESLGTEGRSLLPFRVTSIS